MSDAPMKKEISIEELRKHKIMVATPMYGGMATGMFSKSCIDLARLCQHYGVECQFHFLFNESLIQRARTYLCDEFMRSDMTKLMFIDADIDFNPEHVLALAALDKDIICAPYPKKCIAWEKIAMAYNLGLIDPNNPSTAEQFVGDYVFNPIPGTTQIRIDEPVQVLESGTGFMMIDRSVFNDFEAAYPQLRYLPDHNRTANFNGSREITMFFDCYIDPETKRYLSEDYAFCQRARAIGKEVWLCPWMALKHVGTYIFGGSMHGLAQITNAAMMREQQAATLTSPVTETRQQRRQRERAEAAAAAAAAKGE